MRLSVICFTESGFKLMEKLNSECSKSGSNIISSVTCCYKSENLRKTIRAVSWANYYDGSVNDFASDCYKAGSAICFIGATGIAVRAIAPLVTNKLQDVPVLVMDDCANYVIPILSGHVGGANELAVFIAGLMGATPVITTSTDNHNKFAVDLFAVRNDLRIVNKERIAAVSAAVLAGRVITVKVQDEIAVVKSSDITEVDIYSGNSKRDADVCIADKSHVQEYCDDSSALILMPREYVIGIGCRKGKSAAEIEELIDRCMKECNITWDDICCIASIDVKKDEPGIVELADMHKIKYVTYTADELDLVSGEYSDSEFVRQRVGTGNVCERAAVAAAKDDAELVMRKQADNGVTCAIAKRKWRIEF